MAVFYLCSPTLITGMCIFVPPGKSCAVYSYWALQGLLPISKLIKETIPLKTFSTLSAFSHRRGGTCRNLGDKTYHHQLC